MSEEPKTAMAVMMQSQDERRLEYSARSIAMASAAQAMAENFKRDEIEDARDAERYAMRAAEMAAYLAVQKERERHAEDMALLKQWMEKRVEESALLPMGQIYRTRWVGQELVRETINPADLFNPPAPIPQRPG
jgi:hypothetical protein